MITQGAKYGLLPFWVFKFSHESATSFTLYRLKALKLKESIFYFFENHLRSWHICICLNWRTTKMKLHVVFLFNTLLPLYSEKSAKRLPRKRFCVFFREEAKIPTRPPFSSAELRIMVCYFNYFFSIDKGSRKTKVIFLMAVPWA